MDLASDKEKADKFVAKDEKFQHKVEKFQNKLDKNVMNDRKVHGKPKTIYTVQLSRDYDKSDERGYSFNAHLDKTVMSRGEYKNKKPRGLLHTLGSRIQVNNIGLVLPVVKRNNQPLTNNGGVNMKHKKVSIELRNFTPPKAVMSAASGIKKTALAAESVAFKAGDGIKVVGKPLAKTSFSALKMKVSNEAYKLSQDNTGLKGALAVSSAAATINSVVTRTFSAKRQYHIKKKGIKLENKHDRLQKKLDKYEMKSAVSKKQADHYSTKTDLSASDIKDYRKTKKKAWKKVFDGAEGKKILKKPKVNSMKLASKADTLALKEYKQAKKIYKTKYVKTASVNELTGKVKISKTKVVDYSRKKPPRIKRPHGLIFNSVGAGLGAVRNKAISVLATADDPGVQAIGKGLQVGMEISRWSKQNKARKSKLKFDKKSKASELRLNKLHNKYQLEKEKQASPKDGKKKRKKSQQRQLRKKRNAESFKERLKNTASKLKNKATDSIKNLFKKKNSLIVLGLGAGLMLIVLPILPILLLGGGGSGVMGGAAGTSVYPVDNKVLTEALLSYNDELDKFYNEGVAFVNGLQISSGQKLNPPDVCSGAEFKFSGVKANLRYDIFKIASYLSAKYRNDWDGAQAECRKIVRLLYKVACIEENNDHKQTVQRHVQVGVDKSGNAIYADLTMNIFNYYIYPTDITIDEYINQQLASMGEPNEDGKTEYELHYDMLMESDGGHQEIGTPLPDFMYWTSSEQTSIYEHIPPSQQDTIEHCIGIACGEGFSVTAGGDGIVKTLTESSITIDYGGDFTVTYYGDTSTTQLGTGSKVKDGDYLFSTGFSDSDNPYNLQISVYDNSVKSYVNPAFVMEGYQGQMEENKKRREEEFQQPTEETPPE